MDPKYPNITVQLSGEDGNAILILGRISKALKNAGVDKSDVDAFYAEATSGDYDALLQTAMRWVDVE